MDVTKGGKEENRFCNLKLKDMFQLNSLLRLKMIQ